jgi:hypothetical protein
MALCAPVRSLAAAIRGLRWFTVETSIAIDPIAHLSSLHSPSPFSAPLDREDCSALDPSPREPYHLAVVRAAGIRTAARKIVINLRSGNK